MSAATTETTRPRVYSTRVVQADWKGEASHYIRLNYGHLRNGAKILAALAKTSTRTTEKWFSAKTCPTEDNFFNLLLADRRFREQMSKFTDDVIEYRKNNGLL